MMEDVDAFVFDKEAVEDWYLLQQIVNHAKLSEAYLNLARDFEVMEAKTLDYFDSL